MTGKDIIDQNDLFNKHYQRYCIEMYDQCISKQQTHGGNAKVCDKLIETVAEIVDNILK